MTETKKFTVTPFVRQCLVTAAVSSSVVGQGCLLGFPGVLLPQLQASGAAITVSKDQASWLAAVSSISMLFGQVLIWPVMSRAGRKAAHYAVILAMLLGWLTVALATNYGGLLSGKIMQGLAYGLLMPLRSILIGECTSPRYRGGFLAIIALAKTFGVLFVHLTGSVTSYKTTSIIAMVFPVFSLIVTLLSPESPSWLATRGAHDESRKAFLLLRGIKETPELEAMIRTSKLVDNRKTQTRQKIKDLGTIAQKKEFYKPVIIMAALYIMYNFTGGTVMAAYSVPVLELLMGPDVQANLWMVALDAQRLFFSIVAVYVINRFKRKTMLFGNTAICIVSFLGMAAYVFLKNEGLLPYDSPWIPGILINLEVFSTAMGMSPLPSVLAGEVFPLRYRSAGSSISLVACAAATFAALKSFYGLISALGFPGTYLVYTGIVAASLGVAGALLPETSGQTLQQIEERFRGEPLRDPEADGKKENELLNAGDK